MLLPINDALTQILAHAENINQYESISIEDALGRTLGEDQISSINVPPADNSAMDGYVISTSEASPDHRTFAVSQIIAAGSIPNPLELNTAARIFTGAEIPENADAVIMQEQCEVDGDKVILPSDIKVGQNIRPKGQDIKAGDTILKKGHCLQPQDIGLLASIGIATISVYRQLKVAILSTGDELVEPGLPLTGGKIYNSNRYLLKSFLKKLHIEVMDIGVVEDTLTETKFSLKKAADADCIISTGGVSVGDEDHVKQAVTELGALDLWRIALKPGKPLAFGNIKNTPFFGLPGNPVSTFLTFLLFVRPFLLILQGQNYQPPLSQMLTADFHTKANPKRQEYLRVKQNAEKLAAFSNQSSGVLSSVTQADGLAVIPIGASIAPGDQVQYLPFSQLF